MSDDTVRERISAPPRWRKWLRGGDSAGSAVSSPAVTSWVAAGGQGVLAVHRLGKGYRGRMVVQDVSLSVRRGEAVGLLGPNGAGIGYLPQEASIFRGLNVENNIRAVLEVNEPNRKAREAMLESLLDEFDIARVRSAPSISLSGGERRRCEIARALAGKPSFMLLDEPFAGIDPIAVGDIQDLVRHLKGRGIGVLITDHNVRETLGLIDRAYIIHSGQVLTEGPPEDIIAHPDVRRFYLGEDFRM